MKSFLFQGNWVDLIILVIVAYYASEAWRVGFWVILADFLGFLISIILALRGYSLAAQILRDNFSLTHSLSNALGFLIVAGVSEALFCFILPEIIPKNPYKILKKTLR